jgi:NADPH-ferrihemoprotein reductase
MDSNSSDSSFAAGLPLLVGTGATTILLASALAYVLLTTTRKSTGATEDANDDDAPLAVDKTVYPGGLISVYYATQTGTSESFGKQLEREGAERGFFLQVVDLEDIALEGLLEEARCDENGRARAVFLAATYGEGEAPDNAQLFVEALCDTAQTKVLSGEGESKEPADGENAVDTSLLQSLDYTVFGLGNRQYDHFNAMGKFFDRTLSCLGGQRMAPLGVGDDDNDLEGDFEAWKDNVFWPALKKKYLAGVTLKVNAASKQQAVRDCPYETTYHPAGTTAQSTPLEQVHTSSRHYFDAVDCPVTTVRELRSAQDGGSTVHMEIDISKAKVKLAYTTADNLGVLPVNDPETVASVAESLGYDLEALFSLTAAAQHEWHGAPFPMPLTVRECLTRYCDLTGAPRRSELKLLAAFAKDPLDQTALLRLSSKEGKAEYKEKITESRMGLRHILLKCPSLTVPLEHFLDICPRLQPRFFTIASSSTVHPRSVHLTVAVTKETRSDGSLFRGVCSTHLATSRDLSVRIFHRPSTFRLPKDASQPIVMIGPGTGIAPMRGLLQERAHERSKASGGQTAGKNILYFGCKQESLDYLYQDELQAWQTQGVLDELHTAFSRQQAHKVYVQHLLQQQAAATWKLLEQEGAYLYVCGAVKMGHDVGEALQEIIVTHGQRTPDQAKDYLAQLAQQGRYVQELWA